MLLISRNEKHDLNVELNLVSLPNHLSKAHLIQHAYCPVKNYCFICIVPKKIPRNIQQQILL